MDARRDRLADIERRAREELGQTGGTPPRQLSFREPSRPSRFSSSQLLFLVVILAIVCWLLLQ